MADLFINLPSDVVIDILLRLDERDVTRCKCVRKSWLELVGSREFVKFHLSRSRSQFLAFRGATHKSLQSAMHEFEILEMVEGEGEGEGDDEFVYKKRLKSTFEFPSSAVIHSSVDGLLFLCSNDYRYKRITYVMNPITRECIDVVAPSTTTRDPVLVFGFGVSKESGEYKIIRISQSQYWPCPAEERWCCEVITLGESSWRRIKPPCFRFTFGSSTTLDGKIHWLGHYVDEKICVFDFETEVFSTFSTTQFGLRRGVSCSITVLEGCVCVFV